MYIENATMVENDQIHLQLRAALNQGDYDYVIDTLRNNDDVDVDYRDVTHDLQTFTMRVCYVDVELSSLFAILEAIFDRSPDVNIQDSWGRTVLMHACIANKPQIIEGLLDYENTDISVRDFDGNSALSYATQHCDIYTLEDLLQHTGGASLLTIHNSKGQSPYNIAEKNGNKQALVLFDSYINKSISLGDKKHQRKRRKPRNRDVTRQLPPTYSPSPERRSLHPSPRNIVPSKDFQKVVPVLGESKQSDPIKPMNDSPCAINEKILHRCESLPLTRSDTEGRPEVITSLSLSSPKLLRRHHKQDSLLTETLILNQSKKLPYFKNKLCTDISTEESPPEVGLRRGRRPSVSLPDLRNMTGNLVGSGHSTPNTDDGNCSPRAYSPTPDYDVINDADYDLQDDVFSSSYPNAVVSTRGAPGKLPYRRQCSDVQITLPEINKGAVTLTTPRTQRHGISSLVRQRKYSTSDDQLNRSTAPTVS